MKKWDMFFLKLIEEARTLTKKEVSERNKIALEKERAMETFKENYKEDD